VQTRNRLKVDKTLYQAALRILARREHSILELIQKLQNKDFDQPKINEVIEFLEQKNYLNNSRFAENYARMRANKGYGRLRIQAELKQRGISNDIINSVTLHEQQNIKKIYQKKFGTTPINSLKDKSKRISFLRYKGFEAEEIRKIIKCESV
jgi:regulatory protein